MGYALNVIRVRQQGEIQLDDFIVFLQRGWSSLFNVFELLAALIVVSAVFYVVSLLFGGCQVIAIMFCNSLGPSGFILLGVFEVTLGLLGCTLILGTTVVFWIVIVATASAEGTSGDELSIYPRLKAALWSSVTNKWQLIQSGACIAVFAIFYIAAIGLPYLFLVLIAPQVGQTVAIVLMVTALVFDVIVCIMGFATMLCFYVMIAEVIFDKYLARNPTSET